MPQTAFGTFGSPNLKHAQMGSGGSPAHRPPRAARYNTATSFPVSHPVNPVNDSHTMQSVGIGSISRSASRARPPLHTNASTMGAGLSGSAMPRNMGEDDDDEAEIEDRGQALIRRRQKERKQLRRVKEKERERRLAQSEDATPEPSAPPTGLPDENFSTQPSRGPSVRSVSRARTPSADQRLSSDGYFFPHTRSETGLETPQDGGLSPKDETRPSSIYSNTADEDEDPQDQVSLLDEVVAEVVDQQTAVGSVESDEEEDGEEEEEEGSGKGEDEGVTLKDRQDVSDLPVMELTSRRLILSTPSVCPSGSRHYTANHEQLLGTPNPRCTLFRPRLPRGTYYPATSFGCSSSAGF